MLAINTVIHSHHGIISKIFNQKQNLRHLIDHHVTTYVVSEKRGKNHFYCSELLLSDLSVSEMKLIWLDLTLKTIGEFMW
jgi:hypothetical protein